MSESPLEGHSEVLAEWDDGNIPDGQFHRIVVFNVGDDYMVAYQNRRKKANNWGTEQIMDISGNLKLPVKSSG